MKKFKIWAKSLQWLPDPAVTWFPITADLTAYSLHCSDTGPLVLPKPMFWESCCLRTFALAALLLIMLFLRYFLGWLSHLLQVFVQISPPQWGLGWSVFLKISTYPQLPPIPLTPLYFLPEYSSPSSKLCRLLIMSLKKLFHCLSSPTRVESDKGKDLCLLAHCCILST